MKRIFLFLLILCLINVPVQASAVSTSAKGAILINGDTGEVIYEHNPDLVLPMASTTKIMTALLLCENCQFDREITVTAEMLRVEGSSMGLLAGDKVTLHDLLYGLMLASGNDAANTVAYVLGGTVDGFVKKMNSKALELGLKSTHFATPSGLDAEDHYTTARDLATLTRFAMQNEEFAKAVSTKSATLCYGNPPYKRTLTNHNKLLKSFEDAIGVKTGFTKKSGRCLVSAARRDGKYVIAVTLNDPDDWIDHKNLLEYGLEKVNISEICPEKEEYSLPIIGGTENTLTLKTEKITVSSVEDCNFSCTVKLPQFVYAPIAENEVIGSIVYKKDSTVIKELPLCASTEISVKTPKKSIVNSILQNAKYIFINIWEK